MSIQWVNRVVFETPCWIRWLDSNLYRVWEKCNSAESQLFHSRFRGKYGTLSWVIGGNFLQGLSVEAWAGCGKSYRGGVGPQGVTGKGGTGYKTQREASGEDLHPGICPSTEGHVPSGDPEGEEPRRSPWPPVSLASGPLPPPPRPNPMRHQRHQSYWRHHTGLPPRAVEGLRGAAGRSCELLVPFPVPLAHPWAHLAPDLTSVQ